MRGAHHHAWFLCFSFVYCMWQNSSHLLLRARIPRDIAAIVSLSLCVCHELSRDINPRSNTPEGRLSVLPALPLKTFQSHCYGKWKSVSLKSKCDGKRLPRRWWRDGSVVKSSGCSPRGPEPGSQNHRAFHSQRPHSAPQPSETQVPRHPMPSFELCGQWACM